MDLIISKIRFLYTKFQTRNVKLDKHIANREVSIISNNCWAAEYYTEVNLPYLTPFVGMYIFSPCYIRLLKKLKWYLSQDLKFISKSKYPEANADHTKHAYPIGLLHDVEIHFIHYKSEADVAEKWKRRVQRMKWNKIFVEHSDRDRFAEQHLKEFDELPFVKKVCFTAKNYPEYTSAVWIKDSERDGKVMTGDKLFVYSKKYFDIVRWINVK